MMSLELWIAFTLASSVLLVIPGPTVMLVVSYALGRGRASGWATVPGVALGDLTAMSVSLAGAGAVLAASATLFTALKLCGAVYLIWLGVSLWRSAPEQLEMARGERLPREFRRMFWRAYVVTALNPKSIVFFIAFVPQFIDPARPLLGQAAILIATFVSLAGLNAIAYALLADRMRVAIRRPNVIAWLTRAGGGALVAMGIATASVRRAAS